MNARQKAKKYKQELDALKGMTIPTIEVYNQPIEIYKKSMLIDRKRAFDDFLVQKEIEHILKEEITKQIINCARIEQSYDERMDAIKIDAIIKIVNLNH